MNRSLDFSRQRLACLADASRFRLVLTLLEAEGCVSELAQRVGLSQSCTTRHLQALQGVGLVRGARDGKRVVFRARQEARDVLHLLGVTLGGAQLEVDGGPLPQGQAPAGDARARRGRTDANGSTAANGRGRSNGSSGTNGRGASKRPAPVHVEAAFELVVEGASDLEDLPMPAAREAETGTPAPIPSVHRSDIEDFLL